MGAGCNYTLKDNRDIKAYWLEVDSNFWLEELRALKSCLLELPLCSDCDDYELYYGECFKIVLESTYYGDGIVIDLQENMTSCESHYDLMLSKQEAIYRKIIKHINKTFSLNIATSGYTSAFIEIGKIKMKKIA
jgi:hypothetical protein